MYKRTYIRAVADVQRSEHVSHHIVHFSVTINTRDGFNVDTLVRMTGQEND